MTIENLTNETVIYRCEDVGVAGTTPVRIKLQPDGSFEARCGFALMGVTNMSEEEFLACDHNPFHEKFYDNFVAGKGADEAEALTNLKINMKSIANSLWI